MPSYPSPNKTKQKKTLRPHSSPAAITHMAAEAAPPPSSPSAAGANPGRNTKRKRKPKPKAAGPSALNPNWAQLQSKLPQRPASTHLGKRKHDAGSPSSTHAPAEASPPPETEVKLEPTSDDAR